MESIIENIFNAGSEDYDLGTLESFKKDMSNVETRRTVYDTLKDEYDLGEWEQFSKTIDDDIAANSEKQSLWGTVKEAGKGAFAGFLKQLNELGEHLATPQYSSLGVPTYGVTFDKEQAHAINEVQRLDMMKAAASYDEKLAAAERLKKGSKDERDKALGSGMLLTESLDKEQKKYMDAARKNVGENATFTGLIKQGNIGGALELGMITAIESAPQMIMGMNVPGRIMLGILTAADEYDRLSRERPNMSVGARAAQSIAAGSLEQFFESKFNPLKLEGKYSAKTVTKMIKEASERGWKEIGKDLLRVLKAWGIDATGEGAEEFLTSTSTDLVKQVIGMIDTNGESFQELYKEAKAAAQKEGKDLTAEEYAGQVALGYINDFIGGAMAGGYMGSISHGAKGTKIVADDIKAANGKITNQQIEAAAIARDEIERIAGETGLSRKSVVEMLDNGADDLAAGEESEASNAYKKFQENVEAEAKRRSEERKAAKQQSQSQQSTEQPEAQQSAKGTKDLGHKVTITLDGVEQEVSFSGSKVVYNEDGSINVEQSGTIFLQDADGNVISGKETHDAMIAAINESLIKEKEAQPVQPEQPEGDKPDGSRDVESEIVLDETMPLQTQLSSLQDQHQAAVEKEDYALAEALEAHIADVTQKIEDQKSPEQKAEEAKQAHIQEVSANLDQQVAEKGDKVMDNWTPEESFIYTMTHDSVEEAMKDLEELLKDAQSIKNPTRRRKKLKEIQQVIDTYGPKVQEKAENADENLDNSENNSNFAQNSDNNDNTGVQQQGEGGNQTPQSEHPSGVLGGDRSGLSPNDGEGSGNGGLEGSSTQYAAVETLDELNQELDNKLKAAGINFPAVKVVRVSAKDFHDAIAAGRKKNEDGWRVDVHSADEYENCYCILTEDGHAGIAVKPDGDIVSLFSDNTHPGVSRKLLLSAIANGGRKADFFMTPYDKRGLQNLYWRFGARITGQTEFDAAFMDGENPDWVGYRDRNIAELGQEKGMQISSNHPLGACIFPASVDEAIAAFVERKNKTMDDQIKDIPMFKTDENGFGYDKMIADRDEQLAKENEPAAEEPATNEPVKLTDDGFAILLHDNADKVPLVKIARVSEEDGQTVYREIGTDKVLATDKGYWRVMPNKQVVQSGESDYVFINYSDSQTKRLGIPAIATVDELAAINAQNEFRPKVEKRLPNRGLTVLEKRAEDYNAPLDNALKTPLAKVPNTGETFTLQDLLALFPKLIVNANGRQGRRSIWNQVEEWCEQAAIRSMQNAEGGEFSEERMKKLRSQLLSDIKRNIPTMIDQWNKTVKQKKLDAIFDKELTYKDDKGKLERTGKKGIDVLDDGLIETYNTLKKAIWGKVAEGNPTLEIPVTKVRFTEGWYNPSKTKENPMGGDASIFRYIQTVAEMARQLQDIFEEDADVDFMNVENAYSFPYEKTIEAARKKKENDVDAQFESLLNKIENAKNANELLKLSQIRYSWQVATLNLTDKNPKYDDEKAEAIKDAIERRSSELGVRLDDKIALREEKESVGSEEEQAAAAAEADMTAEEQQQEQKQEQKQEQENSIDAAIADLEAQRNKKMEMLAMARKRGNTEMEEMLLDDINKLGAQIFALNQQKARGSVREITPEQRERNKKVGRRIVTFLRRAGVNVQLVNEEEMFSHFDADEVRYMRLNGAVPYGVEIGKTLYLLEDYLDPNTPVHEYVHLWFDMYAMQHPSKVWEMIEVLKQTKTWKEVLEDEFYSKIKDDEYEVASEVLARLSGEYWSEEFAGKTRLEDTIGSKKLSVKVRTAIRSFWEAVCNFLGKKVSKRDKDFENQVREIVNMTMADVLGQNDIELTEEEETIKDKAIADGTYLQAPNGQPTKLTPKQWLQVRTLQFKRWFGEWDLANKVIRIISTTKEHGFKNFEEARNWAKQHIIGDVEQPEIGTIHIASRSVKKYLNDSAVTKSANKDVHMSALRILPQIIENSIVGETHEDRDNDSNIRDVVRLYGCLSIDGTLYRVKTTVKRYNRNDISSKAYSYEVTEIELLEGSEISHTEQSAEHIPTTNNSISAAKLLKNIESDKKNGKKILDFSQIVDKNGEPKVVYRGSNTPNSYIFHSKYESGAVWFTDDIEVARHYATRYADHELTEEEIEARIQPVFLSASNLQQYECEGRDWEEASAEPVYFVLDDDAKVAFSSRSKDEVVKYCEENGLDPDIEIEESRATGDVAEIDLLNGKDGVVFHNIVDGGTKASNVYVVANNTQAKSATINNGDFDGKNPDIRFHIGKDDGLFDDGEMEEAVSNPDPRNISQEVKDAMEKRKEQVQEKNENVHTKPAERLEGFARLVYETLDNTHGLYLLQQKINAWRKSRGMSPIPDSMDVRSLLNRCSSAIASRITLFDQREGRKLQYVKDKLVAKLEKNAAFIERFKQDFLEEERADGTIFHYEPTVLDLIERYLVARDNVERAELGIPTRGEREFTERMGMSMAEYAELFQEQLTDEELKELWSAVRACTNKSIKELLRGERISQEDYDTYARRQFYVPEKDFAEKETNEDLREEDRKTKNGGRNRQATAIAHKAEGGNTLATNIFANIIHDAKNSIAVAQENLVRKAMFDLMNDNIEYSEEFGIPRPTQVWFVRTGTTDDGQPIYSRTTERPSQDMVDEAEVINILIKQQQERLRNEKDEAVRERIRNDIQMLRADLPIVSAKQAGESNLLADNRSDVPTVKVYVNGVQHEMTFDGMQEVADALNGVYDLLGNDSIVRKANRFIAALCTTYNPTFFAVNIARDTPFILGKGYSQYGFEFVGRFTKALTTDGKSTRKPILQYLNGTLDENTSEGRLFYNFIMGGGNTGYTQLEDVRKIRDKFNKKNSTAASIFELGARLNEYSELLTRFAAYKALIESGYSENEALNGAKNLSVNFNRRGAGNKFINWFNSLSMFSNAAIQGASGFFRSFDSPKRTARAFFGMCFAPAFLGFMNTILCPDDDDDEFVVSDFYRDNYLVLGPIKWPISQEFKPFFTIGVNIAMGMQGRRNAGQIAKSIIQSFTTNLLPVPPAVSQAMVKAEGIVAGDSEGFSDFADVASNLLLPQFANNVQEISNNKDFMGNTLRKYDLGSIPQYKLGENEAAVYKDIAKLFYIMSGGDTKVPLKYKKGSIDEEVAMNINPKEVKKAIGIIVPSGWLDVISSIYGFGVADNVSWSEGEGRTQDFPIVHSFYRPENASMYRYTLYKEMRRITDAYDAITKDFKRQDKMSDEEKHNAIIKELSSKIENASDRGFNPVYWKQLEDAYKATSVYDIAHKLGKTEKELREEYPELNNLEDFQKLVAQLMNEELMEYHGIEHHIPWLQEKMRFWDKKN